MMPLEMGDKQTHFMLSAMPQSCAFCLPGGPEQLVEIKTKTPVKYTLRAGRRDRQARGAEGRSDRRLLPPDRRGPGEVASCSARSHASADRASLLAGWQLAQRIRRAPDLARRPAASRRRSRRCSVVRSSTRRLRCVAGARRLRVARRSGQRAGSRLLTAARSVGRRRLRRARRAAVPLQRTSLAPLKRFARAPMHGAHRDPFGGVNPCFAACGAPRRSPWRQRVAPGARAGRGLAKIREEMRQLQEATKSACRRSRNASPKQKREPEGRAECGESPSAPRPRRSARRGARRRIQPGDLADPAGHRRAQLAGSGRLTGSPASRRRAAKSARRAAASASANPSSSSARNIDPYFRGQLVAALTPENEVEVEEAFFQTLALRARLHAEGRALPLGHRLPERDPPARVGFPGRAARRTRRSSAAG